MTLALTDDHRVLADVAAAFLRDRHVRGAAREALAAEREKVPAFWEELCSLGWLGFHVPEDAAGQGYSIVELAVVLEELGHEVAPGPFLPTAWAAGVLAAHRTEDDKLLAALATGATLGAVGIGGGLCVDATGRLHGDCGPVLGGDVAEVLLLVVGEDVVVVNRDSHGLRTSSCDSLDLTRRLMSVECVGIDPVAVLPGARATAVRVGRTLAAAEAAGGARACTEMAVAYAMQREQFGRVIGSFQAVKHHCANMLVDAELAAAVAWDAARTTDGRAADLSAAMAATQALPAYRRCAEVNIQIQGGIGYTWEHDAHLHLRRAVTLAAVFGADDEAPDTVVALRSDGVMPRVTVDLPDSAEAFRIEARAFRALHDALPDVERRTALVDSGYFVPHWPRPWGRGADVVEQLVIDEELAGVEQADLGLGAWVLLTIVQCGSSEQLARWVRPSLIGELRWCQLFSEPDAGSDAAAIQTRAARVDGGWAVNGQKVWTSDAQNSNWGLATVRTDPEAPKHRGVTTMAIDLRAPGVDVRPLRELTGETLFNEVFFQDVFVPDDDVVGRVNDGWAVARATLGNERVSIGGDRSLAIVDAEAVLELAARRGSTGWAKEIAALLTEAHAMQLLNVRQISRTLVGAGPGVEGNVSKLLAAEHAQRVTRLGMRVAGSAGVAGAEPELVHDYLFAKCLTIAGGTSEIVRNVIAERILGLPRDPLQR